MTRANAPAAAETASQTRFPPGLAAMAEGYDVVLSDVWGVLHNGLTAYAGAHEALRRFRAAGKTVILISNAPRPGTAIIGQLDRLGIPRDTYDDIVTSGDMTRMVIETRLEEPLHHIGPPRDLPIFEGLPVRFASADEAAYVVCSGLLDDATETPEDYRARLERLRARDLPMICANPDIVVEVGDRLVYCAGALAALYEEMGGSATYFGKPHAPVYAEALRRAARLRGTETPLSRVLAIGDAIRTDVAGAAALGVDALFIAKGIHAEELELAAGGLRPEIAGPWFARQTHAPKAAMELLVW